MKRCRACMAASPADTENRIILITDAQPNQGDISDQGLLARLKANAADRIHTTLIGRGGWLGRHPIFCALLCSACLRLAACMCLSTLWKELPLRGPCSSPTPPLSLPACAGVGLDFNTELVEAISKVRGANYYSVHSPGEFKRRLVDDFDFAVT
jgi:hypothetical protein